MAFLLLGATEYAPLLLRLGVPAEMIDDVFFVLIVVVAAAALFAGPIVAGLFIASFRARLVVTMAHSCAAAAVWVILSPLFLYSEGLPTTGRGILFTLLIVLAAGALGVEVSVLVSSVRRALWTKLVEQDGGRCWGCAYPIGKSSSPVCPECGRAATEARRRRALLRFANLLNRRRRLYIAGLVLAWGSAFACAWYVHRPRQLFVHTFDRLSYPAFTRHANGLAAYLPEPTDVAGDGGVLIVAMNYDGPLKPPQLLLVRGALQPAPDGSRPATIGVSALGLPLVVLDEMESYDALRNGLPIRIVAEAIEEAERQRSTGELWRWN